MPVFVGAGTSSFMKGSDGIGVSTATTSQRNALSGVKAGQLIYNDTTNLMEYYNGSSWVPIDTAPTVSNVNNLPPHVISFLNTSNITFPLPTNTLKY